MAGGGGLEPPLPGPEPGVLPLDDPPAAVAIVRGRRPKCQGTERTERRYCSESRRERLGLKRGTRQAGIRMAFPVRGLRPLRSERRLRRNVPNPPIVTRRPRLSESNTPSISAFSARSAETLEPPDAFAIAVTRSALIMGFHLLREPTGRSQALARLFLGGRRQRPVGSASGRLQADGGSCPVRHVGVLSRILLGADQPDRQGRVARARPPGKGHGRVRRPKEVCGPL